MLPSLGFCPKSQDFWSSDLLIIICKLGMLGFFFNMASLSTIHLQTILGFLNQVLRILVKKMAALQQKNEMTEHLLGYSMFVLYHY